jgi:hypothetical protein
VNPPDALDSALDRALARALPPPGLPADFRGQLSAAIAREAALEALGPGLRSRLEREQRERLAEFEAGYTRLRRRTLATLIGGAFAAGAAAAVALPWLKLMFGPNAVLALAILGTVAGLAIGASSWIARSGLPQALQKF